ncbi:MAG: prolyl oligopeptidase family serine peptidase [Bryobacterales bacterium]|nr:prolyl oligopeptidase family serine peptidase [Bryobacterales bacterium]
MSAGQRIVAEYGFWKSPITADLVAGKSIRISEPTLDGGEVYWLEGRPAEGGRTALVRRGRDGSIRDLLQAPTSVRSGVHEYGGGAYAVLDGTVYFSEARDRILYRFSPDGRLQALTGKGPQRYADLEVDAARERIIAVCEDHSESDREAQQSLVAIASEPDIQPVRCLLKGSDFYSNPRVSPDGARLCWLQWQHPNMPWDGTELWVANLGEDGALREREQVAGGTNESIFQPQWSPSGELHYVSDRTGYWNLYRHDGSAGPLHEREAEFGLPQWVFRMSTYGFADDGRILVAYCEHGRWSLGLLDGSGELDPIQTPHSQIDSVTVRGAEAVFRAASPTEAPALVRMDLSSRRVETLRESVEIPEHARSFFSHPSSEYFRAGDGTPVHAFLYKPCNPDFEAPAEEKPPLIIRIHGGPTAAASDALSLTVQFWTSRGFALADLNYGGSSGFGRAYRERLNGQWGVVDVEDAVAAARHFVAQGQADENRLIVKGGSAGGYTALCCLAFRDVFAAGASYYGISELAGLAEETHKFESRYHDTLIGEWPAQEALFRERSPLGRAGQVKAPLIFFQGSDDPVVPKAQTEAMVVALRLSGVPAAYYLFEGESHGFKEAVHIRQALEAELAFYATTLLRMGVRA